MRAGNSIKHVSASGQISLGKEYAGKHVLMSRLEDGTLVIKPGEFIPDNEKWLHTGDKGLKNLKKVIAAAESSPRKNNFNEILKLVKSKP